MILLLILDGTVFSPVLVLVGLQVGLSGFSMVDMISVSAGAAICNRIAFFLATRIVMHVLGASSSLANIVALGHLKVWTNSDPDVSGVFCYQSGNTDNVFLGWLHIQWRSMLHVSMEWRMDGQKNSQMEGDKQKT